MLIYIVIMSHDILFPDKQIAIRFTIIKKVRKKLLIRIFSFSDFNNNKIGKTGGTRFAARCDPQYKNAKRENNILLILTSV